MQNEIFTIGKKYEEIFFKKENKFNFNRNIKALSYTYVLDVNCCIFFVFVPKNILYRKQHRYDSLPARF